jgi:hypothetical protein
VHHDYYTYAYLREDGTPYYIGKGRLNRAFRPYKRRGAQMPKDRNRILILKRNLTEEEAFRHEVYMIAVLGRIDTGTGILRNLTNGGEGPSGLKLSEESKQKMRGPRGPIHTLESKAKIAESRKGKPRSESVKGQIRNTLTGYKHTEEAKLNMSKAGQGRKMSEETKQKIREANTGKRHTPETKQKIREARQKKGQKS